MKQGSIAYCVPTYNHPEAMREVMENITQLFQKYEIDIYIYDSSEDDETRNIITEFMKSGYNNLFYIRMASSISADEKLLLILSGYGLKKQYDYIWPIKDRVYILEETIKAVTQAAAYGYDAIFLPIKRNRRQTECTKELYEDPVLFFRDWAWLATSLESTLFHFNSILKDVDWKKFKEIYFTTGRNSFDHFIALFIGLAKLDKPAIRVIRWEDVVIYTSALADVSWYNDVFIIWAYLWIKAVNALPDCYDVYKKQVIKQETMLPELFGSYQNLIVYKNRGILTREVFDTYRDQWKEISDIPKEEVDLILEGKYGELWEKIMNNFQSMFLERDYEQAYFFFWRNKNFLKLLIGEHNYFILKSCFEIYEQEMDFGIDRGIFYGIYKIEQAIKKYQDFKYFLRRVEHGIAEHTQYEFFSTALKQGLSDNFISFVIQRECIHEDGIAKVIASFVDRYLTENGV